MSVRRHILWGGLVGASAAMAFNLLLWIQFDSEVSVAFLLASLPVCAVLGALFGWVWWRMFGRSSEL